MLIRGVLTGSCYIGLGGTCTIAGSSGAKAAIEFVPKPWFGGEHDRIKGRITYNGEDYCTLSGKWSDQSFYTKSKDSSKELLFDAGAEAMAERKTAPLSEQKEIESHRLWGPVTKALKTKNFSVANAEKSKIEDRERRIRKEREQSIVEEFKPQLFTFRKDNESTDEYHKRTVSLLGEMVDSPYLDEGAWTFNDSLHLRP